MVARVSSLNGGTTRPLKPGTLQVMYELTTKLLPTIEVNPGVRDRLDREAFVTRVAHLSPYKKDHGAMIPHLKLTDAGRAALIAAGWEHGEPRSR